jgi:putative transposase
VSCRYKILNNRISKGSLFKLRKITRQGHHQRLIREKKWGDMEYLIIGLIMQTREIHPGMGLQVMYDLLNPTGVGRDAFISIGFAYGFRLATYKSPIRTTFSNPYSR